MARVLDELFDQYDRGRLNRRQLLRALAVTTGGVLAAGAETEVDAQGAAAGTGLAPAMTLNHTHVGSKDPQKSVEFYSFVLGAKVTRPGTTMMTFPGAKPGNGCWINFSKPGDKIREYGDRSGDKAGVYQHIGYGVDVPTSEFPRIAAEIREKFPDVRPPNLFKTDIAGQEIIIFDPDDVPLQLIQKDFNG